MSENKGQASTDELQSEIDDLKSQLSKVTSVNEKLIKRGKEVQQLNQTLQHSPHITAKKAEMELELEMAQKFINSGAFKAKNAEQAYVMIKAGEEMDLSPIASLNGLYVVNGAINTWGKCTIQILTRSGYKMSYENETAKGVEVVARKGEEELRYRVSADMPVLKKSKAMLINPVNKMRYHGAFQILKFHLPHLISSVSDDDPETYAEIIEEAKTEQTTKQAIQLKIKSISTIADLKKLEQDNKDLVSQDVGLLNLFIEKKKQLEE